MPLSFSSNAADGIGMASGNFRAGGLHYKPVKIADIAFRWRLLFADQFAHVQDRAVIS